MTTTHEETEKMIKDIKDYVQNIEDRKARNPEAWNKFIEVTERDSGDNGNTPH